MTVFRFGRFNRVSKVTGDSTVGGIDYPSSTQVSSNGPKTVLTYNSSGSISIGSSITSQSYTPTYKSRYIKSKVDTVFNKIDYLIVAGGGFSSPGGGGGGGMIESLNNNNSTFNAKTFVKN